MRPNIVYFAAVLLLVLEGPWFVRGQTTENSTAPASNATETTSNMTTDGNSTTGMSGNGAGMATMIPDTPAGNSSEQCLNCEGDKDSNCNNDSPDSSMTGVVVISSCRSCRIYKMDNGEGTPITQIVRSCDMEESCPDDLMDADDFKCQDNSTHRACEWCCTGNKCNNFNKNGASGLMAAVIIGGWSITKVIYVVLSAIAVAMPMPTMG